MQLARKRDRATREIMRRASEGVGSMEDRMRQMQRDKDMLMLTLEETYGRIEQALRTISDDLSSATDALKQSQASVGSEFGWSGGGIEQIVVSPQAREYYKSTLIISASNAFNNTQGNDGAKVAAVQAVFDEEEKRLRNAKASLSSVFGEESEDPLIALAQRLNDEDLEVLAKVRAESETQLRNQGFIATASNVKKRKKEDEKAKTLTQVVEDESREKLQKEASTPMEQEEEEELEGDDMSSDDDQEVPQERIE